MVAIGNLKDRMEVGFQKEGHFNGFCGKGGAVKEGMALRGEEEEGFRMHCC